MAQGDQHRFPEISGDLADGMEFSMRHYGNETRVALVRSNTAKTFFHSSAMSSHDQFK